MKVQVGSLKNKKGQTKSEISFPPLCYSLMSKLCFVILVYEGVLEGHLLCICCTGKKPIGTAFSKRQRCANYWCRRAWKMLRGMKLIISNSHTGINILIGTYVISMYVFYWSNVHYGGKFQSDKEFADLWFFFHGNHCAICHLFLYIIKIKEQRLLSE